MKWVIPREHGAWGMLFAPLLIGILVGGFQYSHILLVFAMLAAYMASNPLIQWAKNLSRNSQIKKWVFGYGLAGAVFGLPLLYQYPGLAWLILPAGIILLINIQFAIQRQERHLVNDLVAMSGLSLGVVAAYYVGRGSYDLTAWLLWAACVLQFFGSALHVKSLIREKGNRTMKYTANLYHGLLILLPMLLYFTVPHVFPYKWFFLAYLISAIRTWLTPFNSTVRPMTIGILEIGNTVWFVLFTSLAFYLV